jgi:hypothetical protein
MSQMSSLGKIKFKYSSELKFLHYQIDFCNIFSSWQIQYSSFKNSSIGGHWLLLHNNIQLFLSHFMH